MNNIAQIFASFREQTSDDTAAALLTLAAVIYGEQADDTPLTVSEAAARLNVSPDTIYDLCESGKLPCQRIGKGRGTIRISPAALAQVGKAKILPLSALHQRGA